MEHTVQLGAGAFLKTICPDPARFRKKSSMKNGTVTVEDCDDSDEEEDDEDEDNAEDEGDGDNGPDGVEIDDGIDFDPGDTLGKLLAGITQVSKYYYLADTN
jgi:hypothetical protein